MTIWQRVLVCAGLFFAPGFLWSAWASAPSFSDQELRAVAVELEWQSLLHYMPKSATARRYVSQVDDPAFFFASDGKYNPLAELRATLHAFYQPVGEQIDRHPICLRPGRWEWLRSKLALTGTPISLQDCSEFQGWYKTLNPHQITLIFAASYLNSPSSMFGHTFMRIDPENVAQDSNWLSWALNFGAVMQSDDNSMLYAYHGLFGGYPGYFTVLPYYEKIKEYSHLENRDLWEYQLNLTPKETQRLVTHLWDLKDIRFDYYFLDENCSYRLLELLEYARPGQILTDNYNFNAIPVDTVKTVVEHGFVADVDYIPAVTSRIQHQLDQLAKPQQHLAQQLALGKLALDTPKLLALTPAEQLHTLRVAYQYLRYRQINRGRNEAARQLSMALLKEINARPRDAEPVPSTPFRPDLGHNSQLLALQGGQQDDNDYGELTVRLSYHDLNDVRHGFLDGASLNLGELRVRSGADYSLRLQRFSAVEIQSHAPRTRFFKPITWRIQTGLERVGVNPHSKLVPQVNGGAGLTYQPFNGVRSYAMLTARLEYNEDLDTPLVLGSGPLLGLISYLPTGTLRLEGQHWFFSDGHERYDWRLIKQFDIGVQHALRVQAQRQKVGRKDWDEFSLELRRYF